MKPWHLRLFAFVIFAVSFTLPAVYGHDPCPLHPGWECAWIANWLFPLYTIQHLSNFLEIWGRLNIFLVLTSGCTNLLVLAYLLLCIKKDRMRTARLILVVATVPCFVATWIFFANVHFFPLIGHYFWVAGTLLFATPEILSLLQEHEAH